jgi:hypothetical protein
MRYVGTYWEKSPPPRMEGRNNREKQHRPGEAGRCLFRVLFQRSFIPRELRGNGQGFRQNE